MYSPSKVKHPLSITLSVLFKYLTNNHIQCLCQFKTRPSQKSNSVLTIHPIEARETPNPKEIFR